MKIYKIALRNIFRNKRRSLLSGTAIAVAAMAIVFLFGLLAGIMDDMENNLWTYMTGAIRVRNAEFDKYERLNPMHLAIPDYESLIAEVEADPAVTETSVRIRFPGRVPVGGTGSDKKITVIGLGVDFHRETGYQDFERTVVEGRLPENGTREALIGQRLAAKIGVGVGDQFTILSQSGLRGSNAFTFEVVGIAAYPMPNLGKVYVQVPLDTAQRFLWLPGQVQEILIKVDSSGESPKKVAERLSTKLEAKVPLVVKAYNDINGMAAMMDIAERIYGVIGIIFFFLGSTLIINTTIMVIFERMGEIGTLGAMGMTGRQLVKLFFLEALFISLMGSIVGILAGSAITGYFGAVGFTAMAKATEGMDTMGISAVLYPQVNVKSTVVVFLYSVLVCSLVTWWPSRRAARIPPVEALRHV